MKPNIFLIALLLLPILALAQGGGGGGGGGGGSSDGSDYYDTYVPNCKGDSSCIENCKKTSTAVTAVIVSVVGVIFLGVGGCVLYKKNKLPKLLCKCCGCHQYQKLKNKFNQVEPGSMSEEQYRKEVLKILGYFNGCTQGQYTFQQGR